MKKKFTFSLSLLCIVLLLGFTSFTSEPTPSLTQLAHEIQSRENRLNKLGQGNDQVAYFYELNQVIGLRQQYVTESRNQIAKSQESQEEFQRQKTSVEQKLSQNQLSYRSRIIHAYKFGRLHSLALLLSAASINEMLIRAQYLRSFSQKRQKQATIITSLSDSLSTLQKSIRDEIKQRKLLVGNAEHNLSIADSLVTLRDQLAISLDRADVGLSLAKQYEEYASQFSSKVHQLIAERVQYDKEKSATSPIFKKNIVEITIGFGNNKGRLLQPVVGNIVSPYGTAIHPISNASFTNLGVIYKTFPNTKVNSIFRGEVIDTFVLPGYGSCIVVSHGEYTTVYANLSEVLVSKGDTVQFNQQIGATGTSKDALGEHFFFAIYENLQTTNPTQWIKK